MGDAHSVTIPEETYEAALAAIPKVARDLRRLRESGALPPLAGRHGDGEPEFEDHRIAFNGVRPHHAETCYLGPTEPAPGSTKRYLFTKTAHRPYDLAVMAAYALWWHHSNGSVLIGSNGSLEDRVPALELLEVELGYVIDVRDLFELSYTRLRFEGGLEVVLELRHETKRIKKNTFDWLTSTLEFLAKDAYGTTRKELGADVLNALRRAGFSRRPVVLYHGRDPVPGFGSRRFGGILFPDAKTTREGT